MKVGLCQSSCQQTHTHTHTHENIYKFLSIGDSSVAESGATVAAASPPPDGVGVTAACIDDTSIAFFILALLFNHRLGFVEDEFVES